MMTTRLNFYLSPNLTIQYYGQPFFSSGKYSDFKYAHETRSDDFNKRTQLYSPDQISYNENDERYFVDENRDGSAEFSFDQPDFNFFQFRSNMVVRWEYSAGSTFYLVWTQDRTGSNSNGMFDFKDDFTNLFDIHPDNIFLIKFNRWFGF